MRHDVVLARYGEIGIKSRPVRRRFEGALQDNIERAFEQEGLDVVVRTITGRFLVASSDLERATSILSRIFGLNSVSPARRVSSKLEELLPAIAQYGEEVYRARGSKARTFAIRARRSGQHPYTSQELARQGGGAVLGAPYGSQFKVDLTKPDLEIHVDVRDTYAYIFADTVDGPGGLPQGTQGKVVVLLKDVNSAAAAWMMLRRGCHIVPVTYVGATGALERARDLHARLRTWYARGDLLEIPHPEPEGFGPPMTCTLCMRQMLRKADLVARRRKAKAVVTGETMRSTTVENLEQFADASFVPVLRPLVGLGPDHIASIAARLGLAEAAKAERHQEPCPLRVRARTDLAAVQAEEERQGLRDAAHEAIRQRSTTSVNP